MPSGVHPTVADDAAMRALVALACLVAAAALGLRATRDGGQLVLAASSDAEADAALESELAE